MPQSRCVAGQGIGSIADNYGTPSRSLAGPQEWSLAHIDLARGFPCSGASSPSMRWACSSLTLLPTLLGRCRTADPTGESKLRIAHRVCEAGADKSTKSSPGELLPSAWAAQQRDRIGDGPVANDRGRWRPLRHGCAGRAYGDDGRRTQSASGHEAVRAGRSLAWRSQSNEGPRKPRRAQSLTDPFHDALVAPSRRVMRASPRSRSRPGRELQHDESRFQR